MSATRVLVAMDGSENSALALKCEYQTSLLVFYCETCLHCMLIRAYMMFAKHFYVKDKNLWQVLLLILIAIKQGIAN